jgi:prophage antirepressor-like protein
MSAQIVPFQFEGEEEVRVIMKNGEPWFVASDLCRVLDIKDVSVAVRNFPESLIGRCLTPTSAGEREAITLSEAGMWRLVMRSDKPKALELQQWLSEHVLPSIRKTGVYFAGISPESLKSQRVQHAIQLVHLTAEFELAQEQLNEHTRQLIRQNQALNKHEQQLKTLEETTAIIDDYVTIKGAAKKLGVRIDSTLAGMMGKVAATRTKQRGLLIRDVADLQHGTVHAYPREIAEEAVLFVTANEPQRLIEKQEAAAKREAKKLEQMKEEASAVPTSNGASKHRLQFIDLPDDAFLKEDDKSTIQ